MLKKICLLGFTFLLVFLLAACGNKTGAEDKKISLAVFDDPVFKAIADVAKEEVEKEGYELDIKYVSDIVTPNNLVDGGDVYANFFQHYAFMNEYNKGNNSDLVGAIEVFVDPAGLYSNKWTKLSQIPNNGTVSIPNDPANNGRALFMLQKEGLLKLKDGLSVTEATVKDIVENPKNLKFVEVEQQMLGRTLKDVDLGFMFTAIAVSNGLKPADALVIEKKEDDIQPFTIVITTRSEDKDSDKTEALRKGFQNEHVRKILKENYPLVITSW